MTKGLILVISGPAGSGKGTVNAYLRKLDDFAFSVSRTTRDPRPGEVDGRDYHFLTNEEFDKYLEENDFLEHAEYCGNKYGTPAGFADTMIESGKNIILEIDVEGAMQVKEKRPDAILIMILPPSFNVQETRLRGRGTEKEDIIKKRLEIARVELSKIGHYDYIVFNPDNNSQAAANDILSIVRAEKCSRKRNPDIARKYFE